jgi:hypothetical protein
VKIVNVSYPFINDKKRTAFMGLRQKLQDSENRQYSQLEKEPVALMDVNGVVAPIGKDFWQLNDSRRAWINNKNNHVLLWKDDSLFLLNRPDDPSANGMSGSDMLIHVAEEGSEIVSDGTSDGKLAKLQVRTSAQGPWLLHGISYANEEGQHAFLATLANGDTAAYLMDADGKLSLIIRSGMMTDFGKITDVGGALSFGIGLNTKGQVALTVRFADGPDTVVLLTPVAP